MLLFLFRNMILRLRLHVRDIRIMIYEIYVIAYSSEAGSSFISQIVEHM